eukprot:COSAG05_NODE_13442_length_430_cov_0.779456_1_plen_52_part_01
MYAMRVCNSLAKATADLTDDYLLARSSTIAYSTCTTVQLRSTIYYCAMPGEC